MNKLSIKDIIKLSNEGEDKVIYFLLNKNEVVYIGKSNGRVLSRINQHLRNKEFDDVKFLIVDSKYELDTKELELIKEYRPKLNIQSNNPEIEITKPILKIIESSIKTKHKVIKLLKINKYYSSRDIAKLINKSTRTVERFRKSVGEDL